MQRTLNLSSMDGSLSLNSSIITGVDRKEVWFLGFVSSRVFPETCDRCSGGRKIGWTTGEKAIKKQVRAWCHRKVGRLKISSEREREVLKTKRKEVEWTDQFEIEFCCHGNPYSMY